MSIPLSYGAGIAIGGMVLNLVQYLLGYHSDLAKFQSSQVAAQLAGYAVIIVGLILAMRAARARSADGSLSYGRGVGTGTLVSLFSGIFSSLFMLVYGKYINPEFPELMYQAQVVKAQLTAEQAEASAAVMRFFFGPVGMTIMIVIGTLLIGVVLSLIIAAFMKRAPQSPPLPPAGAAI